MNRKMLPLLLAGLCALFVTTPAWSQSGSDISISSIQSPSLTPCSGQGTFVIRVTNISASPVNNIVVRDSMPPGVSYVAGSVSGSNTTFGSNVAPNVVTFNVASLPASSFADISFTARANCSVSSVSSNITNTYTATWGASFVASVQTPAYGMLFPSLSITPGSTATYNASCLTPFVRSFTICNGGFGSVDSVVFSDSESNASLRVQGFSLGTPSGLGTSNAKTILKAADFSTIGNMDGKLDQNECIVLYDTLMIVGSTSPIAGTYRAIWGCDGASCSNPSSNTTTLNTTIDASSPLQPSLTRVLYPQIGNDSSTSLFNHTVTYQELITNTSNVTAAGTVVHYMTTGLRYINTGSFTATKNGVPFVPTVTVYNTGGTPRNNPEGQMNTIVAPNTYTGYNSPNSVYASLGDLVPGDSVIVTFSVSTVGQVLRVNDGCCANNTGSNTFCGSFYRFIDGPSIGTAVDARLAWTGCPNGTFNLCRANFTAMIYNGKTLVNEPSGAGPIFLARFRNYGWADSTANDARCAYNPGDTLRVLLTAGAMDLPFFTERSKFYIKIHTTGGVQWDGDLARTFGRLTTWSNTPWYADHVVDSTAYDSTIRVYFKSSNCPIPDFTTQNVYNSYAGGWHLAIGLINSCPGPAQKRVRMTRVYQVDTTTAELPIESGGTTFPANQTWNSICPSACSEGPAILQYTFGRTTFGAPDNDQNGLPDTSGSLDMSKVNTAMITWGDTLQLRYKMIVRTTNPSGVPSLYMNSSINQASLSNAITCNNFLAKDYPSIVLKRPGVGTFAGTATSVPVNNSNTFLANLSLQGTGGVSIPGITTYRDGDTVELTQNIVYATAHSGWGDVTWSFLHVPYTAATVGPSPAQQLKCDSVVCNFHTVDQDLGINTAAISAAACSDSVVFRWGIRSQVSVSGCGTNYFPYESRNVYTPTDIKISIPAASQFTPYSVKLYWNRIVKGGSGIQCAQPLNVVLSPSLYTFAGDTLYIDFRQVAAFYGLDYRHNNLYSIFQVDVGVKYTNTITGCVKDHTRPSYSFPVVYHMETSRPMDTTDAATKSYFNGTSNTGTSAILSWPDVNNNTVTLYAGSTTSVTNSKVVVPVRYTVNNYMGIYGNCWMAIPGTSGVTVDSVKDKLTGAVIPMTPAGSNIYRLGTVGANGATRDYDIYTTVTQCINSNLTIYADRSPCTGYPGSWTGYACQSSANSATFTFSTFPGELQMTDSLYTTLKDICVDDTLQFKVVNSQTQTANAVKISFVLPTGMSLVPGRTYLSYGNGAYTSVPDPVLSAGTYTWTMPATDSLLPVAATPANIMRLMTAVTTDCGYVSGSQILSTINGKVACGDITALYNTNPAPLHIAGAPSLSYLTNPLGTVTQLSDCGPGSDKAFRVALRISGGPTLAGDTVKVTLPKGYVFVSYNAAAVTGHNAPGQQPAQALMPDSTTVLSWSYPGNVAAGDSIVFTFQYDETTPSNKCGTDPSRVGYIRTYINTSVFCVRTNSNCPVSISNGADTTLMFQTQKPSLTVVPNIVAFATGCDTLNGANCYGNSRLEMTGVIKNTGTSNIPNGTPLIMEAFLDLDNSGTITAADSQYQSFVYNGGLAVGDSIAFQYKDTTHASCWPCFHKSVLLRFANTPTQPSGQTQCLCNVTSTTVVPSVIHALPLSLTRFAVLPKNCTTATVQWVSNSEPSDGLVYGIEISTDGRHFTTEKKVNGSGNMSGADYKEDVSIPGGTVYLRLVQILHGHNSYSPVVPLRNNCDGLNNGLAVYPNPHTRSTATLSVILTEVTGGTVYLSVSDAEGKVIRRLSKDVPKGITHLELPEFAALPAGVYIIRAIHADGAYESRKVIKE